MEVDEVRWNSMFRMANVGSRSGRDEKHSIKRKLKGFLRAVRSNLRMQFRGLWVRTRSEGQERYFHHQVRKSWENLKRRSALRGKIRAKGTF